MTKFHHMLHHRGEEEQTLPWEWWEQYREWHDVQDSPLTAALSATPPNQTHVSIPPKTGQIHQGKLIRQGKQLRQAFS